MEKEYNKSVSGGKSMNVDVPIDRITPCLVDRSTGDVFDTLMERIVPVKKTSGKMSIPF